MQLQTANYRKFRFCQVASGRKMAGKVICTRNPNNDTIHEPVLIRRRTETADGSVAPRHIHCPTVSGGPNGSRGRYRGIGHPPDARCPRLSGRLATSIRMVRVISTRLKMVQEPFDGDLGHHRVMVSGEGQALSNFGGGRFLHPADASPDRGGSGLAASYSTSERIRSLAISLGCLAVTKVPQAGGGRSLRALSRPGGLAWTIVGIMAGIWDRRDGFQRSDRGGSTGNSAVFFNNRGEGLRHGSFVTGCRKQPQCVSGIRIRCVLDRGSQNSDQRQRIRALRRRGTGDNRQILKPIQIERTSRCRKRR